MRSAPAVVASPVLCGVVTAISGSSSGEKDRSAPTKRVAPRLRLRSTLASRAGRSARCVGLTLPPLEDLLALRETVSPAGLGLAPAALLGRGLGDQRRHFDGLPLFVDGDHGQIGGAGVTDLRR